MRTIRTVEKTIEITDDILCNRCGKSCYNGFAHGGLIGGKVHGNYGSKDIGDGDIYQFDICEKCFKALAEAFVIPAKVGNSWFPEEDEQDTKAIDEALENLKGSVLEAAGILKEKLNEKSGFIKFGDKLETGLDKMKQGLEDLKDKIK